MGEVGGSVAVTGVEVRRQKMVGRSCLVGVEWANSRPGNGDGFLSVFFFLVLLEEMALSGNFLLHS